MKISEELLEKYLNGACSPAERGMVESWLNGQDEIYSAERRNISEAKQAILDYIDAGLESEEIERSSRLRPRMIWRWSAAAVLLICSLVLLKYAVDKSPSKAGDEFVGIVATKPGQLSTVRLPDGTLATINALSELRWKDDFGRKDRVVYLEGEAIFHVTKDKERPFRVIGENTSVEVLGTVFDFKAYHGERNVLSVTEGRVKIEDKQGNQHILLANEQIIWKAGNFGQKAMLGEINETAWKDKKLVFKNTPMLEVVNTLNRWYGKHIKITSADIENQTLTAEFEDTSLKEIVETLAFSLKFKYEIKGDGEIILHE